MTLALVLSLACSGAGDQAPVSVEPTAIAGTECASCGMFVSEQPSPRGQVVYRDGTHEHFCSLGDMRMALKAPSPHGKTTAIFVESLAPGFDPAKNDTAPLSWMSASEAHYVSGVERPMVMGTPLLSYPDAETAAAEAARLGGQALAWESLP